MATQTTALPRDVETWLAPQPEARVADCRALIALMQQASGHPPAMWGSRMVGFGHHHYVYDSGREGDTFQIGFASGAGGKGDLTLYLGLGGLAPEDLALLSRLGKHRVGKGCVYLKRLSDVDLEVLTALCRASAARLRPGAA